MKTFRSSLELLEARIAPAGVSVTGTAIKRFAVLGPVVVKGAVVDDSGAAGDAGFEAEQIAKITVGGVTVFKHGDPLKYFDFSHFVFAREIAAM